jgi:surface antigen
MADTKTSTKRCSSARTSRNVLSEEERAAMQETIRERKKAAKLSPDEERAAGEADVRAKIAEMAEDDRAMAARIHELVLASAPELVPRTFYGMPAYAKDGKVIVPVLFTPYRSM